jgi:hypothetical protein
VGPNATGELNHELLGLTTFRVALGDLQKRGPGQAHVMVPFRVAHGDLQKGGPGQAHGMVMDTRGDHLKGEPG